MPVYRGRLGVFFSLLVDTYAAQRFALADLGSRILLFSPSSFKTRFHTAFETRLTTLSFVKDT